MLQTSPQSPPLPQPEMLFKLFLAFVIVPIVEFYLLFKIASATSFAATLLLVIATGMLGSFLARREGISVWFRFQQALKDGRMPAEEIQEGMMIIFAAALLLTPGLLTDLFGFSLLIPVSRSFLRKNLLSRFFKGFQVQFQAGPMGTSTENHTGTSNGNHEEIGGDTINADAWETRETDSL